MTDMNTPAWLSDSANGGADALSTVDMETNATVTGSSSSAKASIVPAAATPADEPENPDLPGVILMMRLLNIGLAGAIIGISIWNSVGSLSPSTIVLAVYAICGGLLICCLETQLKFVRVIIAVNFGFLFNSLWRFIFYLLLGSVTWSYNTFPGKFVGIACGAVAFFNTYVLCRYPSYRKMREKIAEEEDRRIEARISKEVKKQALRQINK